MSKPLLSIITVVYNGEKYLEETIQSVISQSYKNIEYIIIDGGSTDGTIDIIRKYEKHISYWVSEADNGQSDALNKGFEKANGVVMAWLNADDYFLPDAFEKFIRFYRKNPDHDFYYSNYLWVDENKKILKTILPYKRYSYLFNTFYGCYIPTSGSFIKPNFFHKVGNLDVNFKYKMDTDIFERSRKKNVSFIKIKEIFSAFRYHSNNVSFRDISNGQKELSKQDLESIKIKDRYFNSGLSLSNRDLLYKFIWRITKMIYLITKYSKI